MSSRPNILCFVTDQQRADHLGCYGNPDVRTPNIDRLAAEGVTFTESFVANPVCMPNRASMWTGRWPKAHGLRENGNTLSLDETVLPQVLKRAGYDTASFGKIHLAPFGMESDKATSPHQMLESCDYWLTNDSLPTPYYGCDEVYLVCRHGAGVFGHYLHDLSARDPQAPALLRRERALEPPTGARESWKSAIPEEFHYNTAIADRMIEYLERRDRSRPFFAWCSFPDPHHPYSPPAPYCHEYDPGNIRFDPDRAGSAEEEISNLPSYVREVREGGRLCGGLRGPITGVTDDHMREIVAHTYGMISMVDANIGRVMRSLEAAGALENTIVVFFSDHGDLMGDHWLMNKGPFLYRGLVRVPTIWRLPASLAGAARGVETDAIVSTVDLMPTLLDLAGIEAPEGVQGRSYREVVNGGRRDFRDFAYVEYDESYLGDRLRHIRSREWSATFLSKSEEGFLFDLSNDPRELRNLWHDPVSAAVKSELGAELFRQSASADDWLPPKACHA